MFSFHLTALIRGGGGGGGEDYVGYIVLIFIFASAN